MRNISEEDLRAQDLERVRQLLLSLGRKSSLRDPIAGTCEEMQLTPAQVHSVMWLGSDGALTMGEVARRLRSTEKTVTGLVDRLEREGLAKRTRDDHDRRVVRVALTKKGQSIHQRLQDHMLSKLEQMMALLEPSERKVLIRILEKLIAQFGASDAPAPTPEEAS